MNRLRDLAAELEADLRERRSDLTIQLHRRSGPFWEDVRGLRERWRVAPIEGVPFPDPWLWYGASAHLPLVCLRSVLRWQEAEAALRLDWDSAYAEWKSAFVDSLKCLGDWLRDVRGLYERAVPPAERGRDPATSGSFDEFVRMPVPAPRRTGGDLFTDHWAPFLSGCVLFDPPRDDPGPFADHVTFDPASLDLTWPDQTPVAAPRIVPPAVSYVRDPDAVEAVERWWHTEIVARLHLRLAPLGIDVAAEVQAIMGADPETGMPYVDPETGEPDFGRMDLVAEYVGRKARIPLLRYLDPGRAERTVRKARGLLARRAGGRPRVDRLEVVRCEALRAAGRTEGEIADQVGFERHADAYGRPRRSGRVRHRLKRASESGPDTKTARGF